MYPTKKVLAMLPVQLIARSITRLTIFFLCLILLGALAGFLYLTPMCLVLLLINLPAASYFRDRGTEDSASFFSVRVYQTDTEENKKFYDIAIGLLSLGVSIATLVHAIIGR
jgi:hypothetical protein